MIIIEHYFEKRVTRYYFEAPQKTPWLQYQSDDHVWEKKNENISDYERNPEKEMDILYLYYQEGEDIETISTVYFPDMCTFDIEEIIKKAEEIKY